MAVFSLIALLALLAGMALLSVRPWEDDSVPPRLTISPDIGVGLDDSVVVAPPSDLDDGAAIAEADLGRGMVAGQASAGRRRTVALVGVSQGRRARQPVSASPRSEPAPEASAPQPQPQLQQQTPPPAAPVEPVPVVVPPAPPPAGPRLVANFEEGLRGWSASVGDVFPGIVGGTTRDGRWASAIRLTGSQSGSHLIFGDATGGPVQIEEGDTFAFGFSFYIQTMVYGTPGADNSIMRFVGDGEEEQAFGLQLWDPAVGELGGDRGLWSSGEAMGGERFLAAAAERVWHDVVVSATASSQGLGSYDVYLDGELVDARDEVSIIAPGSSFAQIGVGLLRDGELVRGTSEIRIDASKLGDTLASVQP